jgi:hypothetical protein
MFGGITNPHRRAANWAGIIAIGLPALVIFFFLAFRLFTAAGWLLRPDSFGIVDAISYIQFPGYLITYLFAIPLAALHGPAWLLFLLMPFVNWLFYYYVIFRPMFRWWDRRAARKQAGEAPRTT